MYTAGKISTCPDWKITCHVGHLNHKILCALGQDLHAQGHKHALIWSPDWSYFIIFWSLYGKEVINSLAFGRCGWNFDMGSVILELILCINILSTSCEIALRWMPQNTFDDKSTFVQGMANRH